MVAMGHWYVVNQCRESNGSGGCDSWEYRSTAQWRRRLAHWYVYQHSGPTCPYHLPSLLIRAWPWSVCAGLLVSTCPEELHYQENTDRLPKSRNWFWGALAQLDFSCEKSLQLFQICLQYHTFIFATIPLDCRELELREQLRLPYFQNSVTDLVRFVIGGVVFHGRWNREVLDPVQSYHCLHCPFPPVAPAAEKCQFIAIKMQFRDRVSMPLCDLVQEHLQYTWPFETEPVSGVQYVCHFLEKSTRNEERVHDSVGARSRGIIIIIDECRCDASERGWHSWIRYHVWVATTGSYAVDAPTAVEVGVNLIPQLTWKNTKAAKLRPES